MISQVILKTIIFNTRIREIRVHRDGEKIDFFDFLSIRLALLIIDKKFHLSIKNRFCWELQKSQ